jgi:enoyl-CoA hydratase/carnithine racemase
MNALSAEMWDGLEAAFEALRAEKDVRLVVVRSSCERAFCTGLDLAGGAATNAGGLDATVRRYQRIFDAIEDHPVPVLAALHGYVLGGGLELAMACDLRLAADDALLGLTEARVGLIPADGGTQRLAKYVGFGRAKYMVLTGERIDANVALQWGLIDIVAARSELEAALAKLEEKLLRAAPLAQRHAKELVRRSFEWTRAEGGEQEAGSVSVLLHSRDVLEGMSAFLEKRPPRWAGR